MFESIQQYFQGREQQRQARMFCNEVKHNLEQYYVMFQINRLRFFVMDEWQKISSATGKAAGPAVSEYARRLLLYNESLKDYKDYEQWYNGDLERKSGDNGRILHQKKEKTQVEFKGLEPVIKAALAEIEPKPPVKA